MEHDSSCDIQIFLRQMENLVQAAPVETIGPLDLQQASLIRLKPFVIRMVKHSLELHSPSVMWRRSALASLWLLSALLRSALLISDSDQLQEDLDWVCLNTWNGLCVGHFDTFDASCLQVLHCPLAISMCSGRHSPREGACWSTDSEENNASWTDQNWSEQNRTEQNQSRGRVLNKCWSNGRGSLWLSLQVTAAAWGRYLETIQLVCCHRSMNIWHYWTWFDMIWHCTTCSFVALSLHARSWSEFGTSRTGRSEGWLGRNLSWPWSSSQLRRRSVSLIVSCVLVPSRYHIEVMQGFLQSAYSTR